MSRVPLKRSRLQRKFLNQMRGMADVPWPARRTKYPAMYSTQVGTAQHTHIGSCKRVLGETKIRRGKLRRKKTVDVRCGGKVYLRRGSLGKRRVYCEDCRSRKRQRQQLLRIERQMQSRFGITPRAQAREETKRSSGLLGKFRRSGAR